MRLSDTPLMAPSITLPELVTGRPLTVAAASVPGCVVAKPRPAAAVPPTVMALALPLSFEISTRRSLMTLAETPTSVVPLIRSANFWRSSPACTATLTVVPPTPMLRPCPAVSAGAAPDAIVCACARLVTTTL